jgi:peptidoglycan-associated lipoprotein
MAVMRVVLTTYPRFLLVISNYCLIVRVFRQQDCRAESKKEFSMRKVSMLMAFAALTASGCATKDYVHEYVGGEVSTVNKRVDGVNTGVDSLNRRADTIESGLRDQNARLDGVSRTAQEALERARAAGKLAEGKLMYEGAMSDDTLKFDLDGAELDAAGKALLDAFAGKLKAENRNVYIEIQGHTDSTGNDAHNLKLSGERAEAVKRYLNMKTGIPLHRMATIAYGKSAPVADNKTRAGREQNRRVVLVVLN